MDSHELARALLARRANDVRILVTLEDEVEGVETSATFLTEVEVAVTYDPEQDVIVIGSATVYGAGYDETGAVMDEEARVREVMRDHPFVGEGPHCQHWSGSTTSGTSGTLTFSAQCGWSRETHPEREPENT